MWVPPPAATACCPAAGAPHGCKYQENRGVRRRVAHGQHHRGRSRAGLAQSTTSRAASSLEDEWGAQLFNRRGPELRLTPDGRRLLAGAQAVCDASAQLKRYVRAVCDLDDGIIGIAALAGVVVLRLPGPLRRIAADHPHVEINISESTYGEEERQLLDGVVELVFIPAETGEGFVSEPYDKDELVVVTPRGHFVPGLAAVPIESFLSERFIADNETAPLLQCELAARAFLRCLR
ncbi:LysR family transcriptional regulator [Paratractidigestivibacter sp.]|uniref:LysR family transcriptional regulator n=1 Tax=Paratractidigestivibacter sp. TaxID=2847316 RepID=UPI002AC9CA7C|nr:LysR family transcriptional regulator [Paratractidigestivibacter sp.]